VAQLEVSKRETEYGDLEIQFVEFTLAGKPTADINQRQQVLEREMRVWRGEVQKADAAKAEHQRNAAEEAEQSRRRALAQHFSRVRAAATEYEENPTPANYGKVVEAVETVRAACHPQREGYILRGLTMHLVRQAAARLAIKAAERFGAPHPPYAEAGWNGAFHISQMAAFKGMVAELEPYLRLDAGLDWEGRRRSHAVVMPDRQDDGPVVVNAPRVPRPGFSTEANVLIPEARPYNRAADDAQRAKQLALIAAQKPAPEPVAEAAE
jgi:hypothetical protein